MTKHIKTDDKTKHEHGSVSSYVVGFILSLALTVVPYYMVTRGITSGTTLLLIVLGLAILQMIVQIFFFLHLGRGPKPFYNVVFFGATAAFIVIVVGASLLIMDNLYRNMSPAEVTVRLAQDENIAEVGGRETGACQGNKADHEIMIGDTRGTGPIVANRCDTLTIKSGDGLDHMLMFGTYEEPRSYGGLDEVYLRSDRAKIITLNEVGDFSLHDHSNPALTIQFSVIEPNAESE